MHVLYNFQLNSSIFLHSDNSCVFGYDKKFIMYDNPFSIYHLVILMHACAFKLLMIKRANRRKVVKPVYRIFGKRCYLCETYIEWKITIHWEDDHYYFCSLQRSCVIDSFCQGPFGFEVSYRSNLNLKTDMLLMNRVNKDMIKIYPKNIFVLS